MYETMNVMVDFYHKQTIQLEYWVHLCHFLTVKKSSYIVKMYNSSTHADMNIARSIHGKNGRYSLL